MSHILPDYYRFGPGSQFSILPEADTGTGYWSGEFVPCEKIDEADGFTYGPTEPESEDMAFVRDPILEDMLSRLSQGRAPIDDRELLATADAAVEFMAQNPVTDRAAWARHLAESAELFDD